MRYTRADFERIYADADLNKDGKISYGELLAFMQKHKLNPTPERLRKYFTLFDLDKNGALDKEEWCKFMEHVFADQVY